VNFSVCPLHIYFTIVNKNRNKSLKVKKLVHSSRNNTFSTKTSSNITQFHLYCMVFSTNQTQDPVFITHTMSIVAERSLHREISYFRTNIFRRGIHDRRRTNVSSGKLPAIYSSSYHKYVSDNAVQSKS
jgi:hypothetical protein